MATAKAIAEIFGVPVSVIVGDSDAPELKDVKPADLADDIPFAFKGREIPPEQMAVLR